MPQTVIETGTYYPETYNTPTLEDLPVEEEEEEDFQYSESIFAPQKAEYFMLLLEGTTWDSQPF